LPPPKITALSMFFVLYFDDFDEGKSDGRFTAFR